MRSIMFFTCSAGISFVPIAALVCGLVFFSDSHFEIALRSYTRPSSAITGSTGSASA